MLKLMSSSPTRVINILFISLYPCTIVIGAVQEYIRWIDITDEQLEVLSSLLMKSLESWTLRTKVVKTESRRIRS